MKIVQTFWSGAHNPLEHSYGWLHAEYNLMSWTLSCLSLRKHYDRVELYTDRRGYEVLIEKLHLPYTQVHVVYDDNLCLPQHWAYAKIKTYSLQDEPFLHVDGDMYFPSPIPQNVLCAPLIAQNREIGTAYYQGMLNRVLAHPEFILPDFIKETQANGTMASYNMGIFGGSDLDFIQRYCQKVFDFFDANHMNDASVEYSNEECNVFFEQIFLATMADKENKDVKGLIPSSIIDNGYKSRDFACLKFYEKRHFFHVLGGMKHGKDIIAQLAKALARLYPEQYITIIRLFPKMKWLQIASDAPYDELFQYRKWVLETLNKWGKYDYTKEIVTNEIIASYHAVNFPDNIEDNLLLTLASHLNVFTIPAGWGKKELNILRTKYNKESFYPLNGIALLPASHWIGYEEFPLTLMDMDVLSFIGKRPVTPVHVADKICEIGKSKTKEGKNREKALVKKIIIKFIKQGIVVINNCISMKTSKKGSPEFPYSYEEYLVLCKFNAWKGGYVKFENGNIIYVDPQEPQDKPTGGSGDVGSGSGSGSDDGSGSGSNDKPRYVVMAGSVQLAVSAQRYSDISIRWSSGIANAPSGGGCGCGANVDGFYSHASVEVLGKVNGFQVDKAEAEFVEPYEIRATITGTYRGTQTTDTTTFTIPPTYYVNF